MGKSTHCLSKHVKRVVLGSVLAAAGLTLATPAAVEGGYMGPRPTDPYANRDVEQDEFLRGVTRAFAMDRATRLRRRGGQPPREDEAKGASARDRVERFRRQVVGR